MVDAGTVPAPLGTVVQFAAVCQEPVLVVFQVSVLACAELPEKSASETTQRANVARRTRETGRFESSCDKKERGDELGHRKFRAVARAEELFIGVDEDVELALDDNSIMIGYLSWS